MNTKINFDMNELEISIEIEVHAVYKTGVEVEAMHGASVIALTIYDMLKPIDNGVEINSIKLLEKRGGKSEFAELSQRNLKAAVVACSDSISQGKNTDKTGKGIMKKLESCNVAVSDYSMIPDDLMGIQQKVLKLHAEKNDLIIISGGAGLSPRDKSLEVHNIEEYTPIRIQI